MSMQTTNIKTPIYMQFTGPSKLHYATPSFHLSGYENRAANTNSFWNKKVNFSLIVVAGRLKLMRVLHFLIIVKLAEIRHRTTCYITSMANLHYER